MPDQKKDEREVVTEIPGYWRLPEDERKEMVEFMRKRKAEYEKKMKDQPKP